MGTPNKLTPVVREQILVAIRAGADLGMAARALSVHPRGIQKLMERNEEFRQAVLAARDFADEIIVKRLFDKARDGDTIAMIFWLKNRQPDIWRDRHDHVIKPEGLDRVKYRATFEDGAPVTSAAAQLPEKASNGHSA